MEIVQGLYDCLDAEDRYAGTYKLTSTNQSIILEGIKKSFYNYGCIETAIWFSKNKRVKISKNKPSPHCLRIWQGGDFTVYFNRSGKPHYFKLKKNN